MHPRTIIRLRTRRVSLIEQGLRHEVGDFIMFFGHIPYNVLVDLNIISSIGKFAMYEINLYLSRACHFVIEIRNFYTVIILEESGNFEPEFDEGILEGRSIIATLSVYRILPHTVLLFRYDHIWCGRF